MIIIYDDTIGGMRDWGIYNGGIIYIPYTNNMYIYIFIFIYMVE